MTWALIAALLCCISAPALGAQNASPAPSMQASPTASPSAGPLDESLDLDGTAITVRDVVTMFAGVMTAFTPAKAAHPSTVFVTKSQREMPAYDPDWHYAGSATNAFGQPELTIWRSARLGDRAPRDLMESTAAIGLLDAGYGGPRLQAAYAKAKAADAALGPDASNPWKYRRALGDHLALMIDALMDILKK